MSNLLSGLTLKYSLGLLILAVCILAAIAKLAPWFQNYQTVKIEAGNLKTEGLKSARIDQILTEQLPHLGYTRYFDSAFARGVKSVTFERDFWIDRCEVRQGDFYKFASWQAFYPDLSISAPSEPPDWRYYSSSKDHKISGRLDAPANSISWFGAYAYCRTTGGRLPSADEWIAAATGKEQRLYPWGDTFNARPWPYLDPLLNAAQKCGLHPESDTPEGLSDMGNNVSEWAELDDPFWAYILMGGNAFSIPRKVHSLTMLYRSAPPGFRSPYIGFRCVYDNKPNATPWRTELDAVAIPAGQYSVGIPKNAKVPSLIAALPKERLGIIQRLVNQKNANQNDLYVLNTEVTRKQYDAFLGDPFVRSGLYAEENEPEGHSYRPKNWDQQMQHSELPVTNVSWWSAYAFAAWAGGRLPTEEEWVRVASGRGQRIYPWGNDFENNLATAAEQGLNSPREVSATTTDVTPEGVFDLAGNVSEWTRSVSGDSGIYAIIVKGGNYLLPGERASRVDFTNHLSPHYHSPTLGFRVVFDLPR